MTSSPPKGVDVPTVLGIAVVVYVLAKVAHEGLGHALTCAALGGKLIAVSSSWCDCDRTALSPWAARAVKAAGTLSNLFFSGVAFALMPRARGANYYALWLGSAVFFFMSAGYLMVDPLLSYGDWSAFLEGLPRALRVTLCALGASLTLGGFFVYRRRLAPLVGSVNEARLLTILPWFVVGNLFMTAAAALNRISMQFAVTSGLATIGGTFMLVWMPVSFKRTVNTGEGLPRSRAWWVAGALTAVWTLAFFGPGIAF